eukprot:9503321-Pyramimonas_sp.AAC.1
MRLTSVALILSFGHLSESTPWDAQAALDASKTPQPADLRDVLAAIPSFGRPLRIASPCVGIHGCGVACQAMRVDARYVNVWDLEAGYEGWLRHLLGGADCITQLNLGAEALPSLEEPIDTSNGSPWAACGAQEAQPSR